MKSSSVNNNSYLSQPGCFSWLKEILKSCIFSSRTVIAQPSSGQNIIPQVSIAVPYSLPTGGDEGAIIAAPSEYPEVQDDEHPPPIRVLERARDIIPDESGQLVPFRFKGLVIKKINDVKCMVGEGAFGQVFRAVMSPRKGMVDDRGRMKLSRFYAVKKAGWKTWLNNEAKCLRAAGEFGYTPWYKRGCVVMHDKGISLDKLLTSGDKKIDSGLRRQLIPSKQRQNIIKQAFKRLQEIHAKDILHSDIKPGNIAINSRGEVSLIDFGSAVTAKGEVNGEKQFKLFAASPKYCSPESCGRVTATQKMDVWSMGIVMFEMEMGYNPVSIVERDTCELSLMERFNCMLEPELRLSLYPKLEEESYREMIEAIKKHERLSKECKDVLLACLAYNPDDRPTAEQLLKFPYFRDKELHEMNSMELVVAHSDAFKALVEAEKALEESTTAEDFMLKDNLDRCQLRVKEIQERMSELGDEPEEKEDDQYVDFPRHNILMLAHNLFGRRRR